AERNRGNLKRMIRERKVLGVGLDKANPPVGVHARGLARRTLEHRMAEVGADDRHPAVRGAIVRQREVAGARTQIEDRPIGVGGPQPAGAWQARCRRIAGASQRGPAMLTAEGCRARLRRVWQLLDPLPPNYYLLLGDPINLTCLANYWEDPISLGTNFHAYL